MRYVARRAPQTRRLRVRGLEFQLYEWSGSGAAPLVLLHGWGDSGATWQFLVDHLPPGRTCLAFDLRGFGRTEHPQDGYWFPDYLADLDALLEAVAPQASVDLIGHSMGGNIALLYAGVRADRIRRLVNLEGFGLPRTSADQAPARYRQWLDQLRSPAVFASYDTYEQFIDVLARRNPRTPRERLEFVARAWARERAGRIELWADPKHKHVNPVLYQREQAEACWREITAPVLFVLGGRSPLTQQVDAEISEESLRSVFRDVQLRTLPTAGHMVHHEEPEALAELLDAFLG